MFESVISLEIYRETNIVDKFYFKMLLRKYSQNSFCIWAMKNFCLIPLYVKYLFLQNFAKCNHQFKMLRSKLLPILETSIWFHKSWLALEMKNFGSDYMTMSTKYTIQFTWSYPVNLSSINQLTQLIQEKQAVNYPIEFRTSLKSSGILPHFWL